MEAVQWKSEQAVTPRPVGSSHLSHTPYLRRHAAGLAER